MSEIVPDVYGQAVVADFGAFGLECVAEEFAAPEQVAAADVVTYAQVDASDDEPGARAHAEIHAGGKPGALNISSLPYSVFIAPRMPTPPYMPAKGLDREEIPDVEMVVDEQGDLHVERTHGHVVDVAVDFGGGPAAAARKADARFEVEGQAAVEQDLVRHGEVESRARTGVYPHVFDRDGAGRHVDAGADAQDVFSYRCARTAPADSRTSRMNAYLFMEVDEIMLRVCSFSGPVS